MGGICFVLLGLINKKYTWDIPLLIQMLIGTFIITLMEFIFGLSLIHILSASTIAFSIAPRLNAAGRLGSAATAVELLLTNDESRARELALLLDTENKERQQTERDVYKRQRKDI